jgi:N-glycosylase/DNA lyase
VATLPPNRIDSDAWTWHTTLPSDDGGSESLLISELRPGVATVLAERDHNSADAQRLLATCRQMLRLDDDLSRFYLVAAADPDIAWATTGAGRMLRSPTVFEDVIKTICTTNCSWSGTERMVAALVRHLGSPDGRGQHAFPSPGAMAKADPEFYREVARTGYRGAYLQAVARQVFEGRLDLENLTDPGLTDTEAEARLLTLPGGGAMASCPGSCKGVQSRSSRRRGALPGTGNCRAKMRSWPGPIGRAAAQLSE